MPAMTPAPFHHSRVLASPWQGVHAVVVESGRSFTKHFHASYGIGLLEHGAHRSASGRGEVDAYAGDVLACNPGEVHDGRPLGGVPSRRWRMLHLAPQALSCVTGQGDSSPDFTFEQAAFQDPPLRAALNGLLDWLDHRTSTYLLPEVELLRGEEYLVTVCHRMRLHQRPSALPNVDHPLARVCERLADIATPAPGLAELAALAGLGKYQLLRRFVRVYGVPPHAWLLQRRVEHAQRLIREGHPLSDAASVAGFADQSHMTRVFSRQFGFTPGDWQRAAAPRRPQ
ncbi:MAG: AraC family transcriptional regulator [Variovorax sp.]